MNTYAKYCPNVWIAKCEEGHSKGDLIELTNKYGKEAEVEIHNLIKTKDNEHFYYSFVRTDSQSYAKKKAEKYGSWANSQSAKSDAFYEASQEGKDFLSLAEPIKVGHHSEKRHRALIERNHNRMGKAIEAQDKAAQHQAKADYWERKANEINLSMPESLDYFKFKLEEAIELHRQYKSKERAQEHNYSMTYAKKAVNDIKKKYDRAVKLWG